MKYVFDTEAVIKATETIKWFCEHQEKCNDCMFNRHVAGSTDHCAMLWDTPSEWNFRKNGIQPTDIPKVGKDIPEYVEIPDLDLTKSFIDDVEPVKDQLPILREVMPEVIGDIDTDKYIYGICTCHSFYTGIRISRDELTENEKRYGECWVKCKKCGTRLILNFKEDASIGNISKKED